MDFSKTWSSLSCFSSECGLCNYCCGNTNTTFKSHPLRKKSNKYYYPGYMDRESIYLTPTNWDKYKRMRDRPDLGALKKVKVRDMYTE
tara:strand:+ start:1428 stop:1691 length:264 start_codon:yes stop_codon:yes gene_type:complete